VSHRRSPAVKAAINALFEARLGRVVLYEEIAAEMRKFNIDTKRHSIAQTIQALKDTYSDRYFFCIPNTGYVSIPIPRKEGS
jgi:hypothetical protein